MSGSMTWREYTTDYGGVFSIKVDKSNANLVGASTGLIMCKKRLANAPVVPRQLTPRYIHCFNQQNTKIRRSFVCGDKNSIFDANMNIGGQFLYNSGFVPDDSGAVVWIITGYTGEKFTCPIYYGQIDTGLTDGSNSQ